MTCPGSQLLLEDLRTPEKKAWDEKAAARQAEKTIRFAALYGMPRAYQQAFVDAYFHSFRGMSQALKEMALKARDLGDKMRGLNVRWVGMDEAVRYSAIYSQQPPDPSEQAPPPDPKESYWAMNRVKGTHPPGRRRKNRAQNWARRPTPCLDKSTANVTLDFRC